MVANASEVQRKILGILSISGNTTVQDLAKRLRLKPHIVRYQLAQMLESNSVTRETLINQRALGYQCFNVFFDLPRTAIKRGLSYLQSQPEVNWLASNVGPRQFEATIIARNYFELDAFFQRMGDEVDVYPREPIFGIEGTFRYWGMRFLSGDTDLEPVADFVTTFDFYQEDELDRKIMHLVRDGKRFTLPKIASFLGVPQSTVKYRIEKLKSFSVISEEFYILDPSERFVQAQLLLNMKSRGREHCERVQAVCQATPYVQVLIGGVGNWDFKIVLYADTIRLLVEVQDSLLGALSRDVAKSSLFVRDRNFHKGVGIATRFTDRQREELVSLVGNTSGYPLCSNRT